MEAQRTGSSLTEPPVGDFTPLIVMVLAPATNVGQVGSELQNG
jgi:hypothetical protein